MFKLSNEQKAQISNAIKNGETTTSGEIYCVIARKSEDYHWVMMIYSVLIAILVPFLLAIFDIDLASIININSWLNSWESAHLNKVNSVNIYILLAFQILVFLIGALLIRSDFFLNLVPKFVKRQSVHTHAFEQFLAHGIHQTVERTGVLIYVSLAEHMVEIVADEGIYKKVDKSAWSHAIGTILLETKNGDLSTGLIDGIAEVSKILTQHFPPAENDINEISDSVIFI